MESIPSGRYDGNLGDIIQNERQIDRFLDVVFEFLHRRTDFYRIMKHENDTMGLPPGVARKYVMQAYMKYERFAQGKENPASTTEKKATNEPSVDAPAAVESVVEVTTTTEVADLPGSPSGSTSSSSSSAAAVSPSTEGTGPSTIPASPSTEASGPRLNPDTGEVISDSACAGGQKTTAPDKPTERHPLTAADTYNGALRENYAWSQTLKDVDLKVFVPSTVTKAKQLLVDIRNDFIKVTIKGSPSEVLVEGKLKEKIRGEETIWSLDPGNCVQLNLEKKREMWWKGVLEGEPEIDQKSIDNTQYVHEMDDDSKTDYQRVMYDMERKRQGLPTSKEEETHNILRKAWNAEGSPFKGSEFDPSKINIAAS